ncbi:HTH domain-containing protein [Staphylococcus aureus]|nr:HTH domain-containing protein [Staphylococcus aureus]WRN72567.1 HTH domain-containing protein [Staphylococcus aureus]
MNCYDEIYNTIKKLIENKEITSYQINKDTGISYGNINAMRRGERRIENLSFKECKDLYEYAKKVL